MCAVIFGIETGCCEGEFVGGLEDADCDFAAVGDEEVVDGALEGRHGDGEI